MAGANRTAASNEGNVLTALQSARQRVVSGSLQQVNAAQLKPVIHTRVRYSLMAFVTERYSTASISI
jgi:hypothetical protein